MTASLEDLRPGTSVGGVVPGKEVTAVALGWHGTTAVTLTYRDPDGHVGERLLYRSDEANLSVGDPAPGHGVGPGRGGRGPPDVGPLRR